jgi:hypothetical protein
MITYFAAPTNFTSRSHKTHNAAHSDYVCITHPAHPLRGQSFPVIPQQKQTHPHLVQIRLADDECRFIPLAWTDQVPPPISQPGARFLLEKLLALRRKVTDLLAAGQPPTILPLKISQVKGGSDDLLMVQADRKTTSPGDRHVTADDPAPNKDSTGGQTERC